jgi:hypothetical protein
MDENHQPNTPPIFEWAGTRLCSICFGPLEPDKTKPWQGGNNAQPVNDGRCCDSCNWTVVIPARMRRMDKGLPPYE